MKLTLLMILLGFNISTSWTQGLILSYIKYGIVELHIDEILLALNLKSDF